MWHRLTSAWTDAHIGLFAGAGMLASLGTLVSVEAARTPSVAAGTLGVVVATFLLASLTDAFGGMVVGLVAAASFTAIHQFLPSARPLDFAMQTVTLGLLFLLGMSSGQVADRIRRGRRITGRRLNHAILPVEGSLGLMSAEDAQVALEDEQTRAELHRRPLTVATIGVEVTDTELAAEEVRRARRAVARSLETELRVTDVVYIAQTHDFGALLPETDARSARDIIESALIVARNATFADRQAGGRRPVGDVATLHVEINQVVTPETQTVAPEPLADTHVTRLPARPPKKARGPRGKHPGRLEAI